MTMNDESRASVRDGGPAFPTDSAHQSGPHTLHYEGMTLRDYFAGQALVSLGMWTPLPQIENIWSKAACEARANLAFMQADAMLQARGD